MTNKALHVSLARGALCAWALLAIAYQVASTLRSLDTAMQHYTTHLTLMLGLIALEGVAVASPTVGSWSGNLKSFGFLTLFGSTVACGLYLYLHAQALQIEQPFLSSTDMQVGLAFLSIVLLLTWNVWGWFLSLLCALCGCYLAFGYLLPGFIASTRLSDNVVISYLAGMGGPRGVFTYMPLSADTIFLLIVYGGILRGTHVIDMFTEIGRAIGNLLRGGVAFSAVMASSLVGMVTGQAVGNIVLAGSVTIPTMIESGFSAEQAGAIECLASNGSQLIPPIMGLGAFLMAANLNVPYIEVAVAGVIPSILYELTVAVGLFFMISASPSIPYNRQRVDWKKIAWIWPSFAVSFAALLVLLFFRYSASYAAMWGIALLSIFAVVRPRAYRPCIRDLLSGFKNGALAGAKLALILAAIGMAVQMLTSTGLGVRLAQWMIYGSNGSLALGLLLGGGISLFIGMGLPTPAAYSLIAIVVIPSLVQLGIAPLVANFYGFYFAIFSSLTPPVAVAILTATRISNGSFRGTVAESIKLAGVCLLLPLLFIQFPTILDLTDASVAMVGAILLFLLTALMLAAFVYSWMAKPLNMSERCTLLIGPVSFIGYFMLQSLLWLIPPVIVCLYIVIRSRVGSQAGSKRVVGSCTFPIAELEQAVDLSRNSSIGGE